MEIRESDIDINFCSQKGIKIAGTWEGHPLLNVFQYIGPLAIKMALEAGYEIFRNCIVVWSDDQFGEEVAKAFRNFKAVKVIQTTDFEELKRIITSIDFIFLADYSETRDYTDESFFRISDLKGLNPQFGIVHLYGLLKEEKARQYNLEIYPKNQVILRLCRLLLVILE